MYQDPTLWTEILGHQVLMIPTLQNRITMILRWFLILHTLIPSLATVPMLTPIVREILFLLMMLVMVMGEFGVLIQKCMFF